MADTNKLADCKEGDEATLIGVDDEQLSVQLFCMGCVPGETLLIERIAPFGDPIIISVEDSFISLRKEDAMQMTVKKK
ncbi:MAG: ferrous iron transport protein A [Flavobacteriales bacterium]|nr:ferrous iron transport protein A [Flavobacteriales bacterium]|tara:strand:+ start:16866 stop:17099 length:234 start_codon:yes stop_codon:yes gene_type:complete